MRRNSGFTLIEILVAMSILTFTVYALADLHIRSMFRMMRTRDQFIKFFAIKNELSEHVPLLSKKFKPLKKNDEDTAVSISVDFVQPGKKSPLGDILGKDLAIIQVEGEWKSASRDYKEKLTSFTLREEPLEDTKP